MNYVKSCLIITMLLGVGNSQCNESNWEDYYLELAGCDLVGAHLVSVDWEYVNLSWADLSGAFLAYAYLGGANLTGANLCNLNASPSGDVCEESVTDENDDGYDDVSYDAGYDTGAESGDLNLDGIDNVLDVVILVENILNP